MPNHAFAPAAMPGEVYYGQAWVPVSDTSCWIYTYSWRPDRAFTNSERTHVRRRLRRALPRRRRVHAAAQRRNDYLIDRAQQKSQSFTGITGVSEQDSAIPGQPGPDPGPHPGTSRADGYRHRRVPQARHGRRSGTAERRGAEATEAAKKYAVRSGAWVAGPDKDIAEVMTERFRPSAWLCRPGIWAWE